MEGQGGRNRVERRKRTSCAFPFAPCVPHLSLSEHPCCLPQEVPAVGPWSRMVAVGPKGLPSSILWTPDVLCIPSFLCSSRKVGGMGSRVRLPRAESIPASSLISYVTSGTLSAKPHLLIGEMGMGLILAHISVRLTTCR